MTMRVGAFLYDVVRSVMAAFAFVVHDCSAISASHWAWSAGYSAVRSLGNAAFTISLVASARTSSASACEGGDDLLRNGLGADLLPAHAGGHVGVDEAGVHGDDERSLASELDAERVRERPRGRLRRAVGRPLRHGDEREHRQHVDQRAAAVLAQDRREGPRHPHRAEVVRLHLGSRGVDGARLPAMRSCGRMPALLTTMETSPQVRAALAMSSALVTSSRTGMTSGFVMRRGVAGGAVDLGAGVEQGLGDGGAEPAVGAGDECGCTFDLHG